MTCLPADDALALGPVAGKSQAGDAVALCSNQFVLSQEAQDHVVQALVVDHVDHRAAAARQKQGVVLLQVFPGLITRIVIGLQAMTEIRRVEIRALREPLSTD